MWTISFNFRSITEYIQTHPDLTPKGFYCIIIRLFVIVFFASVI